MPQPRSHSSGELVGGVAAHLKVVAVRFDDRAVGGSLSDLLASVFQVLLEERRAGIHEVADAPAEIG
jgi:hypothetical protein